MKQIDGLVTKDEMYRLISDFRTRFKISEEAGHEMAKRVAEMPIIEAEPDKGWISVEKRLPEIGERYRSKLVMCYSPDGEHECLFDYYEVNGFGQGCFTAEKYFGITITHWMPLPEPPKEDKDNEND